MENGGNFHGYGYHKLPIPSSSEMNNHLPLKNKTPTKNLGDEEECKVREQDRLMPIANVIRIMRRIVPSHAKISDDAKETVQECVSEFIGFITGEANDRCQREQRKTITAEDILFAMSKLGFDSYVDPLSLFVHRYRQLENGVLDSRGSSVAYGASSGFGASSSVVGGGYYGQSVQPQPGFDSCYGQRYKRG